MEIEACERDKLGKDFVKDQQTYPIGWAGSSQ